ncbi:Na-K-Cl cotransporter (plasmid) [Peptoclostridium acidaminophilum DSM 3953]|uniref:Na-K-Cl cotransporter n=1 Tax=Peptoclostridium acidaminophilum DSM 3953 TaxID=1286171 RepID=W8TK44_PEPAC|nr:amino acid permease [Peptoclostridium acidaminophilum]AHM58118.1 Na-K-Cl cotransporter [Peptoclostridium acidaminophilum DSM 3953]
MKNNTVNNKTQAKGLKTLEGVYVPTLLTILGVIMYLRLGWIVGNVGLWGTLLIIALAHVITFSTSLSMSSMLTNIKIGAGGAYAIITRSLGMEMGGAIGIPLYLSQAISVAFYIAGFSEVWVTFFPEHPMYIVGIATWAVLTALSIASARLAFRVQYFILGAVALSIVSFLTGPSLNPGPMVLTGTMEDASFWATFAIFFPAVTGILTGATMSGDLEDPRRSIIQGTLAAVITGLVAYVLLAVWFARQAPGELLLADTLIILKLARVKVLIVAGIMGAVLSSALSTLVSAPRTLAALAENRIIPLSRIFSKKNSKGEPINAIVFSSVISLGVILMGSLDSLAQLLTMFFMTTYLMINLVVLIEQGTGIISFRPTMAMSIFVPIIGTIGCLLVMLLINPMFTGVTLAIVTGIYSLLKRKNLTSPWGDVRGSIFVAITEWAAQKIMRTPYHPRLWKPAVAVPVESPEDFRRISRFIRNLLYSSGRLYYMTVYPEAKMDEKRRQQIDEALEPLREEGLFVQKILVRSNEFRTMLVQALQCLENNFLPPNAVLLTVSEDAEKRVRMKELLEALRQIKISVMCLWLHPKYNLGSERIINIWLRDRSPNNDLAVLSAIKMVGNLGAELRLCRVVGHKSHIEKAEEELAKFIEEARLPGNTQIKVFTGDFYRHIEEERADLSIVGMPTKYEHMIRMIDLAPGSLLFVASGGLESLLA